MNSLNEMAAIEKFNIVFPYGDDYSKTCDAAMLLMDAIGLIVQQDNDLALASHLCLVHSMIEKAAHLSDQSIFDVQKHIAERCIEGPPPSKEVLGWFTESQMAIDWSAGEA